MKRLYLLCSVAMICALSTAPAFGQWSETHGPYGGSVNALIVDGSDIFAGTNGSGVFRSTNNGSTWTAVPSNASPEYVTCFAMSGSNLFAGTSNGIFLTTDNGADWTTVNTGLTSTSVSSLLVSGSDIFAGTFGGVFLSTNSGTNWSAVNTGLTTTFVNSLGIIGSDLFAGTFGGGVFLSTNNGTGWTAVNSGLTDKTIRSLAVTGTDLFASTFSSGVFLSTDNGTSWSAANTGLTDMFISTLTSDGTNLFAGTSSGFNVSGGVFISTNNGTQWTGISTGLPGNSVTAIAKNSFGLLAGTQGLGFFSSTDNGANWNSSSTGITNITVTSFAVDNGSVFAGTYGSGIFRTDDHGDTWQQANNGLANTNVSDVKDDNGILFTTNNVGVQFSTDGGHTWQTGHSIFNSSPTALDFTTTTIYTGSTSGIYQSTNGGNTFSPVGSGTISTEWVKAIIDLNDAEGVLMVGTNSDGTFISTDQGATWNSANTGLTNKYTTSIAKNGTSLFVGTGGGVFSSTDNGGTWAPIGVDNSNAVSDLFDDDLDLFIASYIGVYWYVPGATNYKYGTSEHRDLVSSYTDISAGLTNKNIKALGKDSLYLYAGNNFGDIWRRPLSQVTTSVRQKPSGIPKQFALQQNYPNPFNPSTHLVFELPTASHAKLQIIDVLGRVVATVVDRDMNPGVYDEQYDASKLSSGVYFYRLEAGAFSQTKKLLLAK